MNQKQYEQLISTWDAFTVPESGFWSTLKEDRKVFVTEVGDSHTLGFLNPLTVSTYSDRAIFVKSILSRDYVKEINDRLKKEGKQTISFVTTELGLSAYVSRIYSSDFRFIHQVELRSAKNKVEIKDYNGIVLNDKPVKAENIIVNITIKYEGKSGETEYQLHNESLADDGRDLDEIVKEYVDIDYDL